MNIIHNSLDIPLVLAVWLIHDEYDYLSIPNYISATGLMKPLRQIILPKRIPEAERPIEDVADYISRGLGHTLHDGVEKAWKKGYQTNLKRLGYSDEVIKRVMINPSDLQIDQFIAHTGTDPIPVYLEQRMFRNHKGRVIGGKYDNITDGIVNDTKSTTAYTWLFGGKDDDYRLQGSIYRWLDANGYEDPENPLGSKFRPRITEDFMRVNFIFTDWQKVQARSNPAYPQKRVEYKEINLLDVSETENWINKKIQLIEKHKDTPEKELPECTPEELWQSDPSYKFYSDPAKAKIPGARSTKNFNDLTEARIYQAEKGGKGVIVTIPGQPKRCEFCPAFQVCSQKDRYFQ